jgi:hypothetical protein
MIQLKRIGVALVIGLAAMPATARAVATQVDLGTASTFAVLAASTVTNTGPSMPVWSPSGGFGPKDESDRAGQRPEQASPLGTGA